MRSRVIEEQEAAWDQANEPRLIQYINLKLASIGCPTAIHTGNNDLVEMARGLLQYKRETDRLLANYLCPADWRIQRFLEAYFNDLGAPPRLPSQTLTLDRPGLARLLSLPIDRDEFHSDIVSSYRLKQGVLHNPRSDRRTTLGSFHIAEGGLPVPADKVQVPRAVFGRLLRLALEPPREMLRLPFTSAQPEKAECFVSLLLRPAVCPAVPGFTSEKTMEVRFFAPGSLVSNLDFVESIFGNAGDPYLPEDDAGLDVEHWTGHTGCIILAPHLARANKKSLGLPHWDAATERQRRDGACWKSEDEPYNGGNAFKITCRDETGVMITLIADNYFGYCKKEIKTQISYAANLFGLCEEEHAGGALVFPSYDLGEEFCGSRHVPKLNYSFDEMTNVFGEIMEIRPEGCAVDRHFPNILYVREDAHFDLHKQTVSWTQDGHDQKIKLLAGVTYVRPSGYRVHLEKPPGNRAWRLIGTVADGTLCHKPCTVSGGGKSEISKSLSDAIIQGPIYVGDFKKDFDQVEALIHRDYKDRFAEPARRGQDSRPVLSSERSLGSVIKLLSPSHEEYTREYNSWLRSTPQYLKELVFVVKRFYKPEWGDDWRAHFSVDIVNGTPGNELRCDNRKLVSNFLRVGYDTDGAWRTFGLRKDFQAAAKIQAEDDITASVVVPAPALDPSASVETQPSQKFVHNCEYRLFQRPDEAIHRGYDRQAEADFARPGNFFSNYEPLDRNAALELIDDAIGFDKYTEPMRALIRRASQDGRPQFFSCTSHPRLVDGKPSKNPRYLQIRPDLLQDREVHLADISRRLLHRVPPGKPLLHPVDTVLPGRRNNPPEPAANIRSLAVFNPVHYLELPELFLEYICSMTGKSPSTTGAGSEGALTKGPFNALPPIIDLNNALVSHLLTGHQAFVTAAGYVGPNCRVDHDVSVLIPEVWSRMSPAEHDPRYLIESGCLERCADFEHEGRTIPFSRLGWRITHRFVTRFFGRVFNHPGEVFTGEMLRPEQQGLEVFVEGVENITATQERVAKLYFEDGSISAACPPLRALLDIMAHGQHNGKGLNDAGIRNLFTREYLLASDWYAERLTARQSVEVNLWLRHARYLDQFLSKASYADEATRLGIRDRLERARKTLDKIKSPDYPASLRGTLGAQPLAPFLTN